MIKNIEIFTEMLTHVSMCTHKKPDNVLVVGSNEFKILDELKKYEDCKVETSEHIESFGDCSFDVVIVDLAGNQDDAFYEHVNRVLKVDGLMVTDGGDYLEDIAAHRDVLATVAKNFIIAMPYQVRNKSFILASKKYHPTADIILQRADFLEGLSYYNCDMHLASFVKPTSIHKALLGVAKN